MILDVTLDVPHCGESQNLLNHLEQYIYDDPSSTAESGNTADDGSAGIWYVPVTLQHMPYWRVRIIYDGVTNENWVAQDWVRLGALAEGEIVHHTPFVPPGVEDSSQATTEAPAAAPWATPYGRNTSRSRSNPPQETPTRGQAVRDHLDRREAYGDMVTRRQREAAERRSRQAVFQINWEDTVRWRTAESTFVISEMEHSFLWQTINWIVRNVVPLYNAYGEQQPQQTPALAARLWIRQQPAFRALVKTAIREDMTFPRDVFAFLKQYVLEGSNTLDGYIPWQDPQAAEQPEVLRPILDQPTVPPEQDVGKNLRQIDVR